MLHIKNPRTQTVVPNSLKGPQLLMPDQSKADGDSKTNLHKIRGISTELID